MTDTPKHPISYPKIALFSQYFGDIENLYTYELELHRKVLKANLGIDTLADMDKAKSVYNAIVGKVRIYDDNEHNRKLIKQKHRELIGACTITTYKEYKRETVAKYIPSLEYLKRSVNKQITNYMKSMKIEDIDQNRLKIYNYIMEGQMDRLGKDIVITYEDTYESLFYDEMEEKHERLRDGNDELQSESNEAFRRIEKDDKQRNRELYEEDTKGTQRRDEDRNDEPNEQRVWDFDKIQEEAVKVGKESEAKSSSQ